MAAPAPVAFEGDPLDRALRLREAGLERRQLNEFGFLKENRGNLGISSHHTHEVLRVGARPFELLTPTPSDRTQRGLFVRRLRAFLFEIQACSNLEILSVSNPWGVLVLISWFL